MEMQNQMYGGPMVYPQGGYPQGGYPQGGYGQGGYGQNGYDDTEYNEMEPEDGLYQSQPLGSQKSFNGPMTEEDRRDSSMRRRRSSRGNVRHRSGEKKSDGLARHGSLYQSNRERSTQAVVSVRGNMDQIEKEEEIDDLKQYYGNMAGRSEDRVTDGVRGTRSYRGDIDDGDDVGKPRRVTNRRNVHGRSATGYGGINFKREIAMRKGEQWGDLEVRYRGGHSRPQGRRLQRDIPPPEMPPPPQLPMPMYEMPMEVFVEQPMLPVVFEEEDVRTYSNLSDAFSDDAFAALDEEDNEFS